MPIKGGLFVSILVALIMRTSIPIKRSCAPLGYKEYEPLMSFTEAEDTGLLWMYALYSPKKPRKLHRCEKLWRKRSLILMLLLIAGIESNPGEFINIVVIIQAAMFRLERRKIYLCNLSSTTLRYNSELPNFKSCSKLKPVVI